MSQPKTDILGGYGFALRTFYVTGRRPLDRAESQLGFIQQPGIYACALPKRRKFENIFVFSRASGTMKAAISDNAYSRAP